MVTYGDINKRRFEDIVKGRVRKNLRDLIKNYGITKRTKKGKISIPLPYIDIPKFTPVPDKDEDGDGDGEGEGKGGLGQGKGNIGDKIFPGEQEGDDDGPRAGEGRGEHDIEVEVSLEELAKIMQEELGLPNIEPKGKKRVHVEFEKYSGLRRVGPDALMRFEPSFENALLRQIALGTYDPDNPIVILEHDDLRFRSWKTTTKPESDAVLIYMMDVSGSMSERHKTIARQTSFWIDTYLRSQYKGIESIYIIHDYEAEEVDYHTFYHTTTSGGTRIASAYELCDSIINLRYNPEEWNIYCFQWSDGDNWGNNNAEFKLLDSIIPKTNLFCYGQIDIDWWSAYSWYRPYWMSDDYEVFGQFYKDMEKYREEKKFKDKIRLARIKEEGDIWDALKIFLSTGQ